MVYSSKGCWGQDLYTDQMQISSTEQPNGSHVINMVIQIITVKSKYRRNSFKLKRIDCKLISVKINLSIKWCLMKTGNCFFPAFNWKGNSKSIKADLAETEQLYRGAQNSTSHC